MAQLLNCCVCLSNGPQLRKITETDGKDHSHLFKLQICVSEIVWEENCTICTHCVTDLDLVFKFRQKCLKSEALRNKPVPNLPKTDEIQDSNKPTTLKKLNQYSCEHCDKTFPTSTKLVAHSVQAHKCNPKNVKPFLCRLCHHRFSTSSNLIQHLRYHDGSRTHMCTFCGKKFKTKNDLSVHERIHLNKKEYECENCHKCFNTHKDLRSHKYVVHTDPSLWQHACDICSKRFPLKSNFDIHMRRHRNEKPFECHLCEKKFVAKSTLQKHILTHGNSKAFSCGFCGKEYRDKGVMNVHLKKVHGVGDAKVPVKVKKHLCHLCPKSYYDRNKLTKHMYSHTGEKPFFCKICQKKFVDGSYVKHHMKKVHDVDEIVQGN